MLVPIDDPSRVVCRRPRSETFVYYIVINIDYVGVALIS